MNAVSTGRILAIHAHPDDESSKGAATTAKYAAAGHEVLVLTCTGGERGDIINPAMDKPGVKENMTDIRHEEMAVAARALGVQHKWLGYMDSGLPNELNDREDKKDPDVVRSFVPEDCFAQAPDEEIGDEIIRVVREFKPHVIITYDENGGYPHPDHLMVHRASMIAWEKAGDASYKPELGDAWETQKQYYSHGFVFQRMKLFHDELIKDGKTSPYAPMLARWDASRGDIMSRVTTQIECADFFQNREDALRAHATQIDPAGAFLATSVATQARLWPTEEFELAQTRVSTSLPETDMFAGITGLDSSLGEAE